MCMNGMNGVAVRGNSCRGPEVDEGDCSSPEHVVQEDGCLGPS
jgi:hypothetical protein